MFDHDFDPIKLSDVFKDPSKLSNYTKKHKKDIIQWFGFMMTVILVFKFFSSGDFSFLLTLSSFVQAFGFLLLVYKVIQSKSINGLSRNSLVSILTNDGYLPYDSTGDVIYRISETATFIFSVILLYLSYVKYSFSYNWDVDTFQWFLFAIPTFVLAILFHPNLNSKFYADVCWTFALYLESVAMFPQLDVFRKKGGEIENYTSHFVASLSLSRIMQFIFWIQTYTELNTDKYTTSFAPNYVGYLVLGVQIIFEGHQNLTFYH
ncbi:hypothetical protein IMG5_190350 [Ichthyophthirius multifiliis]|uniref:ER lumen protein retaining receptor n=1 Tax=Ichthyophthirius multifiliis TaxID=5932 RepID=G0R469_ICHMU|nr:hypothetical protein IMG5_190350 [Ichthyophthirius multifiliis]EGR27740.1 hypothetical protein IMG5_190350 [Ichthyophthirius multifiliis]|eukprot:XP_004025192.1 hypothetical protein IMG5_190350 [Ichthyophthirius multifiliis]